MKRGIVIVILLIAVVTVFTQRVVIADWVRTIGQERLPEPVTILPSSSGQGEAATTQPALVGSLPDEVNLNVPFTPQAPHADWGLPYQEACEEASALMVHRYWTQDGFSGPDGADQAILTIVDFQETNYGFYKDTTAEETARFIRDQWGYSVDVIYDPTIDEINGELAAGFPVIVPAAGRQLGNPYYTDGGPLYHMLVIKGYTASGQWITNDPGTKRGENYVYDPQVIMTAMHDWNGGDVENGDKVIIVIR